MKKVEKLAGWIIIGLLLAVSSPTTIAQMAYSAHVESNVHKADTVNSATRQSPINIINAASIVGKISEPEFHYPAKISVDVVNTGSPDHHAAIKAKADESGAYLNYKGEKYNLLQFHWHTLSEHTLDGVPFPMEVHFVHQKEGATDLNDLLVIGVWYEVGDGNAELDKLFATLPKSETEHLTVSGVNINELFPAERTNYQYEGSLTTPPFTESVHWVVMSAPVSIKKDQLDAFKALFPHGNTRDVQPINRRYVIASDF